VLLNTSWDLSVILILRALTRGSPAAVARRSSHCGPAPAAGQQGDGKSGPQVGIRQTSWRSCSLAKCACASLKKSLLPPELHGSPAESIQTQSVSLEKAGPGPWGRYHTVIPGTGEPVGRGCLEEGQPLGDGRAREVPLGGRSGQFPVLLAPLNYALFWRDWS